MTGPTSAGSVDKKFVEENYVNEGEIAGAGFNADETLEIEQSGNPKLQPGMELNVSDEPIKVSIKVAKSKEEYEIRVKTNRIKELTAILESLQEQGIKQEKIDWIKNKITGLNERVAELKQKLDEKDEMSK